MRSRTSVGFYQRRYNIILGAAQAKAVEEDAEKMGLSISRYFRLLVECKTGVGVKESLDEDEIAEQIKHAQLTKSQVDAIKNYDSSWADGLEKSK